MTDVTQSYATGQHPDLPPPRLSVGVLGWLHSNLFSSPINALMTVASLALVLWLVPGILNWMIFDAQIEGESARDCTNAGACWALVRVRFSQFMFGFYPSELYWRPMLAGLLLLVALVPILFEKCPYRGWGLLYAAAYPFLAFYLLSGGAPGGVGLTVVKTDQWGGLMLTMVIGVTGIAASLPIGVVLALGRRSQMPIVRMLCVAFIEFIRGVPLITILFMSSIMLPLFLPEGVNFDKLLRVLIGVALFSSAYMAEVIRGGLQAIPKGQYEAAQALGLSYWKMMGLIILPQALKIVIPGIVNTFIGLFKDTTLVLIVGLFDLLQMTKSAITDANWIGLSTEAYVFAGATFWIFCFSMSRYSIWLEEKLHTGHKR